MRLALPLLPLEQRAVEGLKGGGVALDVELRDRARPDGSSEARETYDAAYAEVLLEKQAELAGEFDAIHTVERALEVGSLESLVAPERIRSFLVSVLDHPHRGS